MTRVGAQKNLKIFAPENKTVNIVYQEVLGDLQDFYSEEQEIG